MQNAVRVDVTTQAFVADGAAGSTVDLSDLQSRYLPQQFRGQWLPQPPDDIHRTTPLMAQIINGAKKAIRRRQSIFPLVIPHEEQDRAA
jgi:hypothetical protein